jgi:hypothetical protein
MLMHSRHVHDEEANNGLRNKRSHGSTHQSRSRWQPKPY